MRPQSLVLVYFISSLQVSYPRVQLYSLTPSVEGFIINFIISFLFISVCTLAKKIFTLHLGYDSERSGVECVMKKGI